MATTKRFEILSRHTGAIIYAGKYENLRKAVEQAVKDNANLSRANLSGADLTGAYLSGAYLSGACLAGANLTGANLSRANLSGANLSRANLSGANLSGADLRNAISYDRNRTVPLMMLYDQVGAIRAYKLVNANNEGCYARAGNYANSKIKRYEIGESYRVADANTDINEQCGAGIHLATLDWVMRYWQPGYRILIAEFTTKDIACIPNGTDGKFRVHRCKIVGEKNLAELRLVKEEEATDE